MMIPKKEGLCFHGRSHLSRSYHEFSHELISHMDDPTRVRWSENLPSRGAGAIYSSVSGARWSAPELFCRHPQNDGPQPCGRGRSWWIALPTPSSQSQELPRAKTCCCVPFPASLHLKSILPGCACWNHQLHSAYHAVGGWRQQRCVLPLLAATSPPWRYWQGCAHSKGSRDPFLLTLPDFEGPRFLWCVAASLSFLSPFSQGLLSPVCPGPLSAQRTLVTGFRTHMDNSRGAHLETLNCISEELSVK